VTDDTTLGGYESMHDRPPAFEGADGQAYSAAVYVDETPDELGRYGGALLFVRWSEAGDKPVGHLETPYLAFGSTPAEAGAAIRRLSLFDVKDHLDAAIAASEGHAGV
jgi:hypothetical protein